MPERTYRCPICLDLGYVVKGKGEFATAQVCECSAHCEVCGDLGYVMVRTDQGVVAQKCTCTRLRERVKRFNKAMVPARYAEKTLERYRPLTPLQAEIKGYLSRYRDEYLPGSKGVLLWGDTGVGKTHLAVSVVRYLTLEKGISARFVEFFDLLQQIKALFSEGKSGSELMKVLNEVDVLVIDELGKGRGTQWELEVLDQLISARYNSGKTLIATTNYSVKPGIPGGLEERVGKRVMSRLMEMCEFFFVDGPDFRTLQNTSL